MRKSLVGATLAAWLLTGTGLIFGQSSPPPPKNPAPREWRTYVQPAAGFAVSSPIPFGKSVGTTANAEFTGKQVTLKGIIFPCNPAINTPGPFTFYLVTVFEVNGDYRPSRLAPKQKERLLNSVIKRERLLGAAEEVLEDHPFSFKSNPGRELRIRNASSGTKPVVITIRMFLFGDRIYRLQVSRVDSVVNPVEVSRFLDSFRFMTDAEKKKFGTTQVDVMIDADAPTERSTPISGHP